LEENTNSVPEGTAGFGVSVPGHWLRWGVVLSDMEFSRPATWADALAMKAERPAALAIAGGTDVMVDINFDRVRPTTLLDLTGISELAEWSADGTIIRLGAGVPYTGVKRSALAPDELIAAVRVPVADGPQQFSKVGVRNAMVIAVCSFAVALHPERGQVGTGFGSAAPTPRPAAAAEEFLAAELAERGLWDSPGPLAESAVRRFGDLVAAAAEPIDDVRGTAAYRRHSLAVLARRTLAWAWRDYQEEHRRCA